MMWRKTLYGALFVLVLPGLLVLWAAAAHANIAMPLYGNPALGCGLAAIGLALMLTGGLDLWYRGGGLPMNAFPPPKLVAQGIFRFIPHPIYTGFVGICAGMSMLARSASGLWLVTPTVALGCMALVLGYERPDLKRRFGDSLPLLPADADSLPSTAERLRFLLLVVIPWVVLYELTIRLPLPPTRFAFRFEDRLPFFPWTTLVYENLYVAVALAPWCARTQRDLRRLMISSWTAICVVFPFYWCVPSMAPNHPLQGDSWCIHLLRFEHAMDAPVAALPSFHVLWAVFVARLYKPRWAGWCFVGAISASCITTGMHYVSDVILSLLVAPVFLAPQRVWEGLRRVAEWFANSWQEWRFGAVRIINHSFYAGAAAFVQLAIVFAASGGVRKSQVLVTAFAGLVGAGAWAQWIEGSSRLRRPFGFYGGLIGVTLACLFFRDRWTLLAANCLGAPWLQAIGRLRCLVNGCCHGRAAGEGSGIRILHARSRVAHLAALAGVPIYPTQLYSILSNLALGLLLARLWMLRCPLSLVCGIYALGNGLARFVEEAYRGEPQTPLALGLRLYQWVAIASVGLGAALTTCSSPPSATVRISTDCLLPAAVFAFGVAAAMGVDLPESNRPLARLT